MTQAADETCLCAKSQCTAGVNRRAGQPCVGVLLDKVKGKFDM